MELMSRLREIRAAELGDACGETEAVGLDSGRKDLLELAPAAVAVRVSAERATSRGDGRTRW